MSSESLDMVPTLVRSSGPMEPFTRSEVTSLMTQEQGIKSRTIGPLV